MKITEEQLRLHKIIKGSDRVKEARRLFGLAEDEYIITFISDKTLTTKAENREPRKVTPGKKDMIYMHTHVSPYVQKEIIEYFGLTLDHRTVEDAIFWKRPYIPHGFFSYPRVNSRGNYEITFEFYEAPNADAWKEIQSQFKENVRLLEEYFRIKNTKGLQTSEAPYTQIKTLDLFDEKFEITKRYKAAMQMTDIAKRKELLANLVVEAGTKLGKVVYTIDDLRKAVDEFENYFGEVKTA
mgnify:CR=1 FL=1